MVSGCDAIDSAFSRMDLGTDAFAGISTMLAKAVPPNAFAGMAETMAETLAKAVPPDAFAGISTILANAAPPDAFAGISTILANAAPPDAVAGISTILAESGRLRAGWVEAIVDQWDLDTMSSVVWDDDELVTDDADETFGLDRWLRTFDDMALVEQLATVYLVLVLFQMLVHTAAAFTDPAVSYNPSAALVRLVQAHLDNLGPAVVCYLIARRIAGDARGTDHGRRAT